MARGNLAVVREVKETIFLEQRADRANSIIWLSASDSDREKWVEEAIAARKEDGHKHIEVARAFGVADSTLRDREKWYDLRRSEVDEARRARIKENNRINVSKAKSVLADPDLRTEVLGSLSPEERDNLIAAGRCELCLTPHATT
jgi:transposase-like protein